MSNLTRLSKYLSLILRHRAADFGLVLDEQGFASLVSVWELIHRTYPGQYSQAELDQVVAGDADGKKRFELSGDRIRALYGHTKVSAVTYTPVEPPEVLFHGTSTRALNAIRSQGLKPMKRQYVHLAANTQRALKVGARHDETPVVLTVRALVAHNVGIEFYHPEEEHWLAKEIPAKFIEFPE